MSNYSVPVEARKLFFDGIIHNPLHSSLNLPPEIEEAASFVHYVGGHHPVVPVIWRFAEGISAMKGFQASMLNLLLKRKYGLDFQRIEINTDHATLFITAVLLSSIDPNGENVTIHDQPNLYKYIATEQKSGVLSGTKYQTACTNIYRTKEGRFFYLHGNLNPAITQSALGLPTDSCAELSMEEAKSMYADKVSQLTSDELEYLMNDQNRQCGTTCLSPVEYQNSVHGRANAHVGLHEIHHIPNENQRPTWWNDKGTHSLADGPLRPLKGLKVVELSRIIAGPTVSRELAELGASVMRITSPNVPDTNDLIIDLGWGKWNAHLDLRKPEDRETLKELIMEADVVVDGYRPGVLAKYGFGKEDVLEMTRGRERGIIIARVNCYGWNGPFIGRGGWVQISDANCGMSHEYGKALGVDGPVGPVFPSADYSTGVAGATGVLQAIIQRGAKGGSYVVDVALNYYCQWMINSCSTYPPEIWRSLRASYPTLNFEPSDSMMFKMATFTLRLMQQQSDSDWDHIPDQDSDHDGQSMGISALRGGKRIFNPEFFEVRENKAIGKEVKRVKPILKFVDGGVELGYNVGFRGNGVDKARWPEDLMVEVVQ
ncbi:hypothetical protein CVT24_011558 [Panaeolus cyanescens]|uniref:Uncharacterized protein n=1 Tax=Panaeolus cyanescens TaxID=181874 RepID=A0A409VLU1_9AGAR|nr:hypothetical protein CVT24_011558 [Panaeolus cyanescens]